MYRAGDAHPWGKPKHSFWHWSSLENIMSSTCVLQISVLHSCFMIWVLLFATLWPDMELDAFKNNRQYTLQIYTYTNHTDVPDVASKCNIMIYTHLPFVETGVKMHICSDILSLCFRIAETIMWRVENMFTACLA